MLPAVPVTTTNTSVENPLTAGVVPELETKTKPVVSAVKVVGKVNEAP